MPAKVQGSLLHLEEPFHDDYEVTGVELLNHLRAGMSHCPFSAALVTPFRRN